MFVDDFKVWLLPPCVEMKSFTVSDVVCQKQNQTKTKKTLMLRIIGGKQVQQVVIKNLLNK